MSVLSCRRLLLIRKKVITLRRFQHGYVVLIPEFGEDSSEINILFKNDGLPEFNHITIENCRAAIAKQSLDFEQGVTNLANRLQSQCNNIFTDLFEPLEKLGTSLDMTWGLSKTLYLGNSTLMPTSSYMSIHERASAARSCKYTNESIYNAVKLFIENKSATSPEETRILHKFAVEGKLNGLDLKSKDKEYLIKHMQTLSKERAIFRNKTDISTKQFSHTITDPVVIRDFPPDLLQLTAVDPNVPLKGPWKITLQPHIYMKVMQYCSDRTLRWNVWQSLVSRGSNTRTHELTTSLNLEEIRYARRDIAKLLGYDTYVDMSMETKMAGSATKVKSIISSLLTRAKPTQEQELKQLHDFAVERGFQHDRLELWDVPYWRRKQQSTLFGYSDEEFKEYFPLNTVLGGLFQLCEKLFNVQIRQRSNVVAWHKDVKFYDIFETHSSAPIAGFYLDPFARSEEKIKFQTNGWMVGMQNLSRITERKPLSALIFNFDPPGQDGSSYLSFKEVTSLFNKFGSALQHLLTRTNYSEVAGLSNIEWDVVEMSGHVLSHWLFNKQVIDTISCHCDSQDKLPAQMFESLLSIHKHLAGVDLCKELYLSALDLELHSTKDFWLDVIKRLWPEYRPFKLHSEDMHPLSFTTIVSDEWGAAYFCHVWSRMIAADVYSAFHEVQHDEQQILDVGRRYRDTFLALGGSVHPAQLFREFRGRDPSPKALLSSLGIKKIKDDKN